MAQRVPANIARTKNLPNSKKKLLKRRDCTAESRNSSKSLARSSLIEIFADKHGAVRTVRLKLGSENNAQRELVRPIAKIVLLVEDNSPMESQGLNQN